MPSGSLPDGEWFPYIIVKLAQKGSLTSEPPDTTETPPKQPNPPESLPEGSRKPEPSVAK